MKRGYFRGGLLALCLLAFAGRLYLLEDLTLHEDEALSLQLYVQQPFSHILTHYTANNHWLTSLLGHLLGWLGPQRFWLRWPSVVLGTLAIPLIGLAGQRLFRRAEEGLLAAALLSLAAFHWQWSQQFRGYSALLFFGLLSLVLLTQTLRQNEPQRWAALLGAVGLALLSHLFGGLVLLSVGLSLVLARPGRSPRPTMAVSLVSLLSTGGMIWFGKSQIIEVYHPLPQAGLTQLIRYQWAALAPTLPDLYEFLAGLAVAFTTQPHEGLALALFWGFSLLGLAVTHRPLPQTTRVLSLWLLLPLAAVICAEITIAGFFVFDRFLIFLLPVWLLLVSRSLSVSRRWLAATLSLTPPYRNIVSLIPLIGGLGYLSWLNLSMAQAYFAYRAGHDWRHIATYLADHTGPNDLILCHQMPHRASTPAPTDECTRELGHLLAASAFSPPFAIDRLETVATPSSPLRFDPRIRQPGAIWLVLWGATVPQAAPAASPPPFELHRFDRRGPTTVLKVTIGPSLVANLGDSLGHLAHLDSTAPALYDYYRRQAEILAFQGNLIEAQASLNMARRMAGDDPVDLATIARTAGRLPGQTEPDRPSETKTTVDFGRPLVLRLVGYSVPARLQANQTIPVSLTWQVRAPLPAAYSIFLHLRGVDGQNVAQLDFRPFDDTYPTSRWVPRTKIKETRFWMLPPELPAGTYSLYLGLYQVETLARLPLAGDEGGENALLLDEIEVE